MQKLLAVLLSLLIGLSATSQYRFADKEQNKIDSLYKVINKTNYDTTLASAYAQLASIFYDNDLDSNAKYSEKAIAIAEKGLSEATNTQIIKSFSTSLAWGFMCKATLLTLKQTSQILTMHRRGANALQKLVFLSF